MKAVIQAGGSGRRLREITKDYIPKPLAKLNGIPILEIQMEQLKRYGITEIYVVTGYLGDRIIEHFGDGSAYNLHIQYIKEDMPLGSAGALYYLKHVLSDEDFLLIFGDVIFDIDLKRMIHFHQDRKSEATLFVHPNGHPEDSDLIILDQEQRVIAFDSKKNKRDYWYSNCVNAGFYILSGNILNQIAAPQRIDLERDLLANLVNVGGNIYGYRSSEYVKDAGTVERFYAVEQALREKIPERCNLQNKQKCIFLDRDGTLNRFCGLVVTPEKLELENRVSEAIRKINASEYLAIVVTNQPVVARGMCTMEQVRRIHRKLETLLGREGAYLDDIIFCPHHPDRGFPEENRIYKVECCCRKPKTGMIEKMAEQHNIDLQQSYMIGDTTTDIMTGMNAGLRTILVETGEKGLDKKYNITPDIRAKDLFMAVEWILGG